MRFRVTIAAIAAVILGVAVPASSAHAQEADEGGGGAHLHEELEESLSEEQLEELEGGLGEEEFECLLEQVETVEGALAGDVSAIESCEEAPNPILPATNEIIWAVISFAVLFVLLARFAWPAIQRGLEGREATVREDLEAAEQARRDGEQALSQYQQQLAEARNEAAQIIEEAREAADGMRREVQENAEAEVQAARERAESEIEQNVARARSDLQREMADFAVSLAERIVERNLDRDAQMALIDQYIEEVGGMQGGGGGDARDN